MLRKQEIFNRIESLCKSAHLTGSPHPESLRTSPGAPVHLAHYSNEPMGEKGELKVP